MASSVSLGDVLTLTATVKSGSTPLTRGLVNFCDAAAAYCTDVHILGSAQLTSAGTAVLRLRPRLGENSIKAVFAGTRSYLPSTSPASTLSVTDGATSTSITQSGTGRQGIYTLKASVTGSASRIAPTGKVSFVDRSDANAVLGTAQLGTGTLAQSFTIVNAPRIGGAKVVGDFNGDGIPDVFVKTKESSGSNVSGWRTMMLGNGDGTFNALGTSQDDIHDDIGHTYCMAVGDFNGDGNLDVVISAATLVFPSGDVGPLKVLLGKGDGTFGPAIDVPITINDNDYVRGMAVADFDGDGMPDLAVSHMQTTSGILLGNGDGTFRAEVTFPTGGLSPLGVGDFNGDGNLDIAGSLYPPPDSEVGIFMGKGDGTFYATQDTGEHPGYSFYLAVADFNQDGLLDLDAGVSGDSVGQWVLLGESGGGFKRASYTSPLASLIGDFNGDSIADLAGSKYVNYHEVSFILPANGDGTFEPAIDIPGEVNLRDGADFNGDGIEDFEAELTQYPGGMGVVINKLTTTATATLSGIRVPAGHQVKAVYEGDALYAESSSDTISPVSPPWGAISQAMDARTHSKTVAQADTLVVGGWALDLPDSSPVNTVQVLIDGKGVGNATLGLPRPDVAAAYNNPAYLNSGWTFTYPASGLSLGKHTVSAVGYDSLGLAGRLDLTTFTVATTSVGSPWGAISQAMDARTHSSTVGQADNLVVGGWALDPQDGAPVSRVQILIDGSDAGNATLSLARPDVAAAYNNPAYLNSGWTFTYPALGLSLGKHTVSAVGYDSLNLSGMFSTATFTVATTSVGPPWGAISQVMDARTHSRTVSQADNLVVGGWALDPQDGAPVSRVQILIDGNNAGDATLSLYRPDVAAAYNNAAYKYSGWSLTYAASGLSLGTHTVSAVGYDSLGLSATIGRATFTVQ
ncbi:FG-GAP-like repeat-containing protein [Occallatibacter riparius]|uniref:FG-GAP-like repeat-containing protein n=1 Tax=Occallatibacter riparius TaxID=1002689 RepID=A0A9J7BUS5_9BACT|nr:FG-GAP-like repeat-containing protein [Occallatibacter riparius]UWZ86376.1 FG-GAP-like repeat-containing protein [Occallatibacter riparius]